MAILFVTGVAGTGKTLFAIQKYIVPELKKNTHVYTNIDGIDVDRLAIFYDMDIVSIKQYFHIINDVVHFYNEVPDNALIVIDEVQNIFNNREFQTEDNKNVIKYAMVHRHHGHTVIFITPSIDSVDAGLRRVIQFTYKHKSMSMIGLNKNVTCAIFDQCNLQREPLQVFKWVHDDRIYSCYKSYFSENVKEKKIKLSVIPYRMYLLILIIIALTIVFIKNPFAGKIKKQRSVSEKVISNDSKFIQPGNRILINDTQYIGR